MRIDSFCILSGLAAANALSIPTLSTLKSTLSARATTLVDLSVFPKFATISPQQIAADAAAAIANPAPIPPTVGASNNGNSRIAAAAATCTNPSVRIEWRRLSDAQQAAYVRAAKCVFGKAAQTGLSGATNRHMDMAALHQVMTPAVHETAFFLPWHRYYTWVYERILREECGYGTAPFPWWDETLDAGRFSSAPVWGKYFGNGVKKTASGQGTCITSGVFGNTTLSVGPGTSNSGHCLSRAVDDAQSAGVSKAAVDNVNKQTVFSEMSKRSFLGPHGLGHNSVGAVMSDVYSSPGDPIFFLHHAFIDHNWRIWQNMDASRLTQINGCRAKGGVCSQISLDDTLSSRGIRPDVKVRDMMNTLGGVLCYKYDY